MVHDRQVWEPFKFETQVGAEMAVKALGGPGFTEKKLSPDKVLGTVNNIT